MKLNPKSGIRFTVFGLLLAIAVASAIYIEKFRQKKGGFMTRPKIRGGAARFWHRNSNLGFNLHSSKVSNGGNEADLRRSTRIFIDDLGLSNQSFLSIGRVVVVY